VGALREANRHQQVQVAVLLGRVDQRRPELVEQLDDDLGAGDAGDAVGEVGRVERDRRGVGLVVRVDGGVTVADVLLGAIHVQAARGEGQVHWDVVTPNVPRTACPWP